MVPRKGMLAFVLGGSLGPGPPLLRSNASDLTQQKSLFADGF